MIKFASRLSPVITVLYLLLLNSCTDKQKQNAGSQSTEINLTEMKKVIKEIDQNFAEDFKNGDSLALAGYYAKDGRLGSVKGKDKLTTAFNKMIQNAVNNGTPVVKYTTTSLSSDGEFLIEAGLYQYADRDGNVKGQGKYLVVWKQEDGQWKIYRDIGL